MQFNVYQNDTLRHDDCSFLSIKTFRPTTETKKEKKEMSNQVYQYITDKIIDELEQGCVPWHKPWRSPDGVRVATSFITKKPYRGINTFLLAVARLKAGYESNYWLTFKQVQALGGNVSGQRTEMVVFWKLLE